jgi:hypothetical protein
MQPHNSFLLKTTRCQLEELFTHITYGRPSQIKGHFIAQEGNAFFFQINAGAVLTKMNLVLFCFYEFAVDIWFLFFFY